MPKAGIQRVQDSVHGLMEFKGMESQIIELLRTPEIQRLRRIRQMGLACLVFPGAEHSRFVHSLGASHLAIRFGLQLRDASRGFLVDVLRPNEEAIRDFSVAALCHDLGHGPLSHAWEANVIGSEEGTMEKWKKGLNVPDTGAKNEIVKWHELVTDALLADSEGRLHKLLEQYESGFSDRLRHLLRGDYYLKYLPRLLRSDIDIDRAEYLMRDSYHCGVKYGVYDLEWLLSTLTIGTFDKGQFAVGFDERKSLRIVEQFLRARRAMYEAVYYHKTIRCVEGMMGLFLKRLKIVQEDIKAKLPNLLSPFIRVLSGEILTPAEILALDDFALWVLVQNVADIAEIDPTVHDLAERILSRQLFKMIHVEPQRLQEFLIQRNAYEELYEIVRPYCAGDPKYYVLVDEVEFEMFASEKLQSALFIDPSIDERPASRVRDHEKLRKDWEKKSSLVRLFAVPEAVSKIKDHINSRTATRA